MKICLLCKENKSLEAFSKDKGRRLGFCDWCKDCFKERQRKYRKKNREQLIEKSKQYYSENNEYYIEYRKRNKVRKREYNIRNCNKVLFSSAKRRAKEKNLDFDIALEDITIPNICPFLDIPLDFSNKDHSPSLDRIDNTKGYIKGNIQVISWRANRLKNDATVEELRKLVDSMEKQKCQVK